MAWHGKSDTGVKSGALYAFPWYFRRILPRFQNLDFTTDCFKVGDTPIFFIHTVCTTPVLLQSQQNVRATGHVVKRTTDASKMPLLRCTAGEWKSE
tara:strand:- start:1340 stop:1627 length:288 start_codon:yes stop_codon:yes gene_type:complete